MFVSTPAFAYSYSGTGAVGYAHLYACNGFVDYVGPQSWVSATSLYDQLVASDRLASIANPRMLLKYSGANSGDIYLYDWGHGNGFGHVSLATDNGNFANYYDPDFKVNYTSITGGSGSRMVQHTTDRDWAPWNFGYWNENDPDVRAQMKTKILRIAPTGQ